MNRLLLILIFLGSANFVIAQTDTSYSYFGPDWNPVNKADAVYYKKVFRQNNLWHKQDFWFETNRVKIDGYYEDSSLKVKDGIFLSYSPDGSLVDSAYFIEGIEKYFFCFYGGHKTHAYAEFDAHNNIIKQQGWDENGNEIPGYVYQKPAEFPGGPDEWQHYIIVELQKNLPHAFTKGQIWGNTTVSFLVLADGSISDVKVDKTSGYPELDYHAVNLIKNSPQWMPAVQFNKTVDCRQTQLLTYLKQ